MIIKILDGNIEANSFLINESLSENETTLFLLDDLTLKLHEYIDKLHLNEMTYYYKLRIAKNLSFEGYITDNIHEYNIKNLYAALKDINLLNIDDYTLVIRESDNFLDIVQQLIYLDIHINITNEEIHNVNKNNKYSDSKENTEINISVMASKKSGKSTFVNCIIGRDISPEGLLPTITNCHYMAHQKNNYLINHGHVNIQFNNSEQIRKYISDLFKNTVITSDVYIKYPVTEKINFFFYENKVIVIDTPGHDFSLQEHYKKIAMETLKIADIILFIIDYEKHFQTSEIEYIEEIIENFITADNQKTLIFIINKIDSILHNPYDKRSIIMVTDFIRCKLLDKGYKNFIVFSVSAYFHYRYLKINEKRLCNKFSSDMKNCIECSNNNKINCGASNNEIKKAIQKIDDLKDILMVENATLENLRTFSSIEKFIYYLNGTFINKIKFERLKKL